MITVNQIKKIEDSKRQIKKEIYKKILEQFSRKIQVSVGASQKQVFLEVPVFLIGYPSYNIESAAMYLKRQLELGGFKVVLLSPIVFNVSWYSEKEKKKEKEVEEAAPSFSDEYLPSLVNLKKAAKKYA